jgi:hypothetical protein
MTIWGYAFENCIALKWGCFPNTLQRLWEGCFKGCFSLEFVDFTECSQLKCIHDLAFEDCAALKGMYFPIPSNLRDFFHFRSIPSLNFVSFYFSSVDPFWFDVADEFSRASVDDLRGCSDLRSVDVPHEIIVFYGRYFLNTGLSSIVVPDGTLIPRSSADNVGENLLIVKKEGNQFSAFLAPNYKKISFAGFMPFLQSRKFEL